MVAGSMLVRVVGAAGWSRACFKGLTSRDVGVSVIDIGEVSGRWFSTKKNH
jgi:hypothetical protein